jgi:hypothetical protein
MKNISVHTILYSDHVRLDIEAVQDGKLVQ